MTLPRPTEAIEAAAVEFSTDVKKLIAVRRREMRRAGSSTVVQS